MSGNKALLDTNAVLYILNGDETLSPKFSFWITTGMKYGYYRNTFNFFINRINNQERELLC